MVKDIPYEGDRNIKIPANSLHYLSEVTDVLLSNVTPINEDRRTCPCSVSDMDVLDRVEGDKWFGKCSLG